MSSSEEFNDLRFVESLPIRRGLEESPRFSIPKSIILQLSEMIAEKKIKSEKNLPPKLVGRVPFNLIDDATAKPAKMLAARLRLLKVRLCLRRLF